MTVFLNILPIYFIILVGVLFCKFKILDKDSGRIISKLQVYLLLPCFILKSLLGETYINKVGQVWGYIVSGVCFILIGFIICAWVAKFLFGKNNKENNVFTFSNGVSNYIYFPVVILGYLNKEELISFLLTFNIGVELAIWSIGIYIINRDGNNHGNYFWISLKSFLNPPFITMVIALMINLIGWGQASNNFLLKLIQPLGDASIGIGILLFGIILGEEIFIHKSVLWNSKISLGSISTRLALIPLIIILFTKILNLNENLNLVLAIQTSMPCAFINITIAKLYSKNTVIPLQATLATITAGIVLTPLWIIVATKILNISF